MKYLFYGCSKWLKFTLDKFDVDYSLIDFTDSNEELWGKDFMGGKKCLSPDEINFSEYTHFFVGSTKFADEIEGVLKQKGVQQKNIVPCTFLVGLWERWKKVETFKKWKSIQENENIHIIKNWFMDGKNASCIIQIENLIGCRVIVEVADIYLKARNIEITDVMKSLVVNEFTTKESVEIVADDISVFKITIQDATIGIPWITFKYDIAPKEELLRLKRGKEFLRVYSEMLKFPFYDEDYTVLEKMGNSGGTILDVGANYGQSMFAFYHLVKSNIMSFEVQPDLYNVLLQLKRMIDTDERIQIVNSGVSAKSEELIWYEPDNPMICGSFDPGFLEGKNLKVEIKKALMKCSPLDELLEEHSNIWFIKLDVEGLEYEALQGAREIIESNYPVILIEQNDKLENIKSLLDEKYDVFYYDLYHDKFVAKRISRLNCWLIPKEKYRNEYTKQLVDGRI